MNDLLFQTDVYLVINRVRHLMPCHVISFSTSHPPIAIRLKWLLDAALVAKDILHGVKVIHPYSFFPVLSTEFSVSVGSHVHLSTESQN